IARWLSRLFPAHRASLTLRIDAEHLRVVALEGENAIPLDSTLPVATTAAGQAFARREVWITSNTLTDDPSLLDLQMLHARGLRSCINVPLVMSGKCFGCLNLGHGETGAYDNADIPKMRALAFWIASQLNHYENLTTIFEAMTRERATLRQLDYLARHDSLTGLLNRHEFTARLAERLRKAPAGAEIGLLYLDLDGFKAVNDTFGHAGGDTLLQLVEERITENVRAEDLVARFGGDEFAIAIGPMRGGNEGRIADVGTRLVEAIRRPFQFDDHIACVTASIGIRVARARHADVGAILREADLALYQVKKNGGSKFRFFDEEISDDMRQRALLAADLLFAIERKELEVHYQPLVNTVDHRVVSCEALVRWRHPVHGLVPPDQFIAMAESTAFIVSLGEWVLRTACFEVRSWPENISVSVNVSPRQFAIGDVVEQVSRALRDSGIDPRRLSLEITETVLLSENEMTLAALDTLGSMGVRIVLDDFGVGHASFNYLKQFKFDKLKIDKSLIDPLLDDDKTLAIVQAIVRLAEALSIETTAEGVETQVQRDRLCDLGCNELQGFLFSRPLPCSAVRALLAAKDNDCVWLGTAADTLEQASAVA
ncbi:MAG: putative bifunctional diguanylate cyclase/phosphodiesterase, partial [Hyphomicrobiaceae bacterium]